MSGGGRTRHRRPLTFGKKNLNRSSYPCNQGNAGINTTGELIKSILSASNLQAISKQSPSNPQGLSKQSDDLQAMDLCSGTVVSQATPQGSRHATGSKVAARTGEGRHPVLTASSSILCQLGKTFLRFHSPRPGPGRPRACRPRPGSGQASLASPGPARGVTAFRIGRTGPGRVL